MSTMNISLSDPLKRFVEQQVRDGGYSGASDYVRELLRQQRRAAAEANLRRLIAEGLASGPATPVTKAWFREMRKRARSRAAE